MSEAMRKEMRAATGWPAGEAVEAVAPPALWRRAARAVARERALAGIVLIASLLLLGSLNRTAFWIDESINAMIGRNILEFGYPVKWDGAYLVESYFDTEAKRGVVEITHGWLQYYVTAAAFALLGQSTAAARLPFALMGIGTIIAVYFLARRLSGCGRVATLAALLLALNPGFLLYSRSCRYFALAFLLSALLLLSYLRWSEAPDRRNWAAFTLCSALLFHAHYPVWPFLMTGVGVYFIAFDRRDGWRRRLGQFAGACLAATLLALPWVLYAQPYLHDIPDWSGATYGERLAMMFWKTHTWVFPFAGLLMAAAAVGLLSKAGLLGPPSRHLRARREYLLLLGVPLYLSLIILAKHPMFSSQYTAPTLPFAVIAGAVLILWIRERSRLAGAVVLALVLATNAFQVLPFALLARAGVPAERAAGAFINPRAQFNRGTPLAHYLHEQLALRSPLFEVIYFAAVPYRHRLQAAVEYLNRHASPGQTVLAPWHDADALRFYTGLRVVYHFKPTFTIPAIKALVYQPDLQLDWVVPNAYYEPDQPFFKYDRRDYERVYIDAPKDYIYENEPNLDFFMWRTNADAPPRFFILKRKSAVPRDPSPPAARAGG